LCEKNETSNKFVNGQRTSARPRTNKRMATLRLPSVLFKSACSF
jgi:hypothetical protein